MGEKRRSHQLGESGLEAGSRMAFQGSEGQSDREWVKCQAEARLERWQGQALWGGPSQGGLCGVWAQGATVGFSVGGLARVPRRALWLCRGESVGEGTLSREPASGRLPCFLSSWMTDLASRNTGRWAGFFGLLGWGLGEGGLGQDCGWRREFILRSVNLTCLWGICEAAGKAGECWKVELKNKVWCGANNAEMMKAKWVNWMDLWISENLNYSWISERNICV